MEKTDTHVTPERLQAFLDTQDKEHDEEFYGTDYEMSARVMTAFAAFMQVPFSPEAFVPVQKLREVEAAAFRDKVYLELLPEIERLFDLKFKPLLDASRNGNP